MLKIRHIVGLFTLLAGIGAGQVWGEPLFLGVMKKNDSYDVFALVKGNTWSKFFIRHAITRRDELLTQFVESLGTISTFTNANHDVTTVLITDKDIPTLCVNSQKYWHKKYVFIKIGSYKDTQFTCDIADSFDGKEKIYPFLIGFGTTKSDKAFVEQLGQLEKDGPFNVSLDIAIKNMIEQQSKRPQETISVPPQPRTFLSSCYYNGIATARGLLFGTLGGLAREIPALKNIFGWTAAWGAATLPNLVFTLRDIRKDATLCRDNNKTKKPEFSGDFNRCLLTQTFCSIAAQIAGAYLITPLVKNGIKKFITTQQIVV